MRSLRSRLSTLAFVSFAASASALSATALTACDSSAAPDGGASLDGDTPLDTGRLIIDDATPPDAQASDAGPATVGLFVASGHAGRTLVSCDDGHSWTHDRVDRFVDEEGVEVPLVDRCFENGDDCDHHPGSTKGVFYGNGGFFRTTGWGHPGRVTHSVDGVDWATLREGTTYGGLGYDPSTHVLVGGSRTPDRSPDDGATWAPSANEAITGWNVRRTAFVPDASGDGGLFVIVGNDGTEVGLSDDGVTWHAPASIDAACGSGIQGNGGIARLGDAIVIAGGTSTVCRSTDRGETWTTHTLPDDATPSSSALISTGDELFLWAWNALLRSSDGATWTSEPVSVEVGAVARNPAGTFVAVRGGWSHWYEQQFFYRSTDGVNWETLDVSVAPQGHPISWIAWGEVPASACAD